MWDKLRGTTQTQRSTMAAFLDDNDEKMNMALGYGSRNAAFGYSVSIKAEPTTRPPPEFFGQYFSSGLSVGSGAASTSPALQQPPPRNPSRLKLRTTNLNLRPSPAGRSQTTPSPDPDESTKLATKYSYRYGGGPEEISPPSSPEPESGAARRYLAGDVSPIDEDDGQDAPQYVATTATTAPATDNYSENANDDRFNQPALSEPRYYTPTPPPNRVPTSIPVLRRERRREAETPKRYGCDPAGPGHLQRNPAPQQPPAPAGDAPRWDPLTGELTSSARGRSSQATAAESEYFHGLGITTQSLSQQDGAKTTQSFGDRVRKFAKKAAHVKEGSADPAAAALTSSRPAWRGPSGRTAIVDPVYDNPDVDVGPLKIPEKSSKRTMGLLRGQTPPISPHGSETATRATPRDALRRILPSSHKDKGSSATTATQPPSARYPSPPLFNNPVTNDAPAVAAKELVRDGGLPSAHAVPSPAYWKPGPSETLSKHRRKPPPVKTTSNQHHHQVSVSSVYSQDDIIQPQQAVITEIPSQEPWVQPLSRFSISTYATSYDAVSTAGTTFNGAEGFSNRDQSPVPSLPAGIAQPQQMARNDRPSTDNHSPTTTPIHDQFTSPVLAERVTSTSPPLQPMTKTTKVTNPALVRAQAVERPSSRASGDVNKSLPPAPPEQTAEDRIALLHAQLSALANRRINIERSIKQMTELMPVDTLLSSAETIRRREEEKKKVEALKDELDEVKREEHELGMKLHRAVRRLEREGLETPTLWIRRVTS